MSGVQMPHHGFQHHVFQGFIEGGGFAFDKTVEQPNVSDEANFSPEPDEENILEDGTALGLNLSGHIFTTGVWHLQSLASPGSPEIGSDHDPCAANFNDVTPPAIIGIVAQHDYDNPHNHENHVPVPAMQSDNVQLLYPAPPSILRAEASEFTPQAHVFNIQDNRNVEFSSAPANNNPYLRSEASRFLPPLAGHSDNYDEEFNTAHLLPEGTRNFLSIFAPELGPLVPITTEDLRVSYVHVEPPALSASISTMGSTAQLQIDSQGSSLSSPIASTECSISIEASISVPFMTEVEATSRPIYETDEETTPPFRIMPPSLGHEIVVRRPPPEARLRMPCAHDEYDPEAADDESTFLGQKSIHQLRREAEDECELRWYRMAAEEYNYVKVHGLHGLGLGSETSNSSNKHSGEEKVADNPALPHHGSPVIPDLSRSPSQVVQMPLLYDCASKTILVPNANDDSQQIYLPAHKGILASVFLNDGKISSWPSHTPSLPLPLHAPSPLSQCSSINDEVEEGSTEPMERNDIETSLENNGSVLDYGEGNLTPNVKLPETSVVDEPEVCITSAECHITEADNITSDSCSDISEGSRLPVVTVREGGDDSNHWGIETIATDLPMTISNPSASATVKGNFEESSAPITHGVNDSDVDEFGDDSSVTSINDEGDCSPLANVTGPVLPADDSKQSIKKQDDPELDDSLARLRELEPFKGDWVNDFDESTENMTNLTTPALLVCTHNNFNSSTDEGARAESSIRSLDSSTTFIQPEDESFRVLNDGSSIEKLGNVDPVFPAAEAIEFEHHCCSSQSEWNQHADDTSVHHFNWLGKPVETKSNTAPVASLATILGTPKYHPRELSDRLRLLKFTLLCGAMLYLDPVIFRGPLDILALRGTALQDTATGFCAKIYSDHGQWRHDVYDEDEDIPELDPLTIAQYADVDGIVNGVTSEYAVPVRIDNTLEVSTLEESVRELLQDSLKQRKEKGFVRSKLSQVETAVYEGLDSLDTLIESDNESVDELAATLFEMQPDDLTGMLAAVIAVDYATSSIDPSCVVQPLAVRASSSTFDDSSSASPVLDSSTTLLNEISPWTEGYDTEDHFGDNSDDHARVFDIDATPQLSSPSVLLPTSSSTFDSSSPVEANETNYAAVTELVEKDENVPDTSVGEDDAASTTTSPAGSPLRYIPSVLPTRSFVTMFSNISTDNLSRHDNPESMVLSSSSNSGNENKPCETVYQIVSEVKNEVNSLSRFPPGSSRLKRYSKPKNPKRKMTPIFEESEDFNLGNFFEGDETTHDDLRGLGRKYQDHKNAATKEAASKIEPSTLSDILVVEGASGVISRTEAVTLSLSSALSSLNEENETPLSKDLDREFIKWPESSTPVRIREGRGRDGMMVVEDSDEEIESDKGNNNKRRSLVPSPLRPRKDYMPSDHWFVGFQVNMASVPLNRHPIPPRGSSFAVQPGTPVLRQSIIHATSTNGNSPGSLSRSPSSAIRGMLAKYPAAQDPSFEFFSSTHPAALSGEEDTFSITPIGVFTGMRGSDSVRGAWNKAHASQAPQRSPSASTIDNGENVSQISGGTKVQLTSFGPLRPLLASPAAPIASTTAIIEASGIIDLPRRARDVPLASTRRPKQQNRVTSWVYGGVDKKLVKKDRRNVSGSSKVSGAGDYTVEGEDIKKGNKGLLSKIVKMFGLGKKATVG